MQPQWVAKTGIDTRQYTNTVSEAHITSGTFDGAFDGAFDGVSDGASSEGSLRMRATPGWRRARAVTTRPRLDRLDRRTKRALKRPDSVS